jgi:transaldolase
MQAVVSDVARALLPTFERSSGVQGYACAQVNPGRAGDREGMLAEARRFHLWAPNIAVKLPVTSAGLDVMEECAAAGITFTATVSFTSAQLLAVAERNARGRSRALAAGVTPGRCFVAMMIGRLDDYLREVAQDQRVGLNESDIPQAGLAVVKRCYQLYCERSYEACIIVAALRGTYHITELVGARVIMSVHPTNQQKIQAPGIARELGIERPIPADVLARLQRLPEFVRAYDPDALQPADFVTFGVTQRTLSQFVESGWKLLEST